MRAIFDPARMQRERPTSAPRLLGGSYGGLIGGVVLGPIGFTFCPPLCGIAGTIADNNWLVPPPDKSNQPVVGPNSEPYGLRNHLPRVASEKRMTTKEKFGLLLGIPSWIPERYRGLHILGAVGVLLGMILSHVLFPQAGIQGEIVGLLVGYYLTLGLVLTVGIRFSWLEQLASSNSLAVTGNLVAGLLGAGLGFAGVLAYVDTRDPIGILGAAFFGVGAVVLFKRAWRNSSRI